MRNREALKALLSKWITFDRWGTPDWQLGFGWWDGALELYLGPLIVRFQHSPRPTEIAKEEN